jgi:hypothetical protein
MTDPAITTKGSADHGDRLRKRLTELRAEALECTVRRGTVEPGHLPLIAGVAAALDALASMPIEAEAAARAVVSDDGREIRLTLYGEAGAIASMALDPVRAIALAGRLIGVPPLVSLRHRSNRRTAQAPFTQANGYLQDTSK